MFSRLASLLAHGCHEFVIQSAGNILCYSLDFKLTMWMKFGWGKLENRVAEEL